MNRAFYDTGNETSVQCNVFKTPSNNNSRCGAPLSYLPDTALSPQKFGFYIVSLEDEIFRKKLQIKIVLHKILYKMITRRVTINPIRDPKIGFENEYFF